MTNEQRARRVVEKGEQITLPYKAGDSSVMFISRRRLVELIAYEIKAAVEAADKSHNRPKVEKPKNEPGATKF